MIFNVHPVAGALLLDHENGSILLAKYYHPKLLTAGVSGRESFEKRLGSRIKGAKPIALDVLSMDEFVVQCRVSADIVLCIVTVEAEKVNELMIESLLNGLLEAANDLANSTKHPSQAAPLAPLDRSFCLANYDIICLLVNEAIDNGLILETDGKELARRVRGDAPLSTSSGHGTSSGGPPSLSSAFQFARDRVTQAFLNRH